MAVFNGVVGASTDDARNIAGNSTFSAVAATHHLGKFNTTTVYYNGWRWSGVTIPNGATISSAIVTLYCSNVNGGTTAKTIWYGEAADNPAAFSNTTALKPEGRTHTSASTAKDFTISNWTTVGYNTGDTIDVTSIVQEIVNRGGWASGNSLVIVATDNGSANTNYIGYSTYDNAPAKAAKLDITYTSGQVATPSTANVTISSFVPTVVATDNKIVGTQLSNLTLTSYTPSITTSNHRIVTPTTSNLGAVFYAPSIGISDNQLITPLFSSIVLSTYAPTVSISDNKNIVVGQLSVTLSTFAPDVTVSGNVIITAGVTSLVLLAYEPTVTATGATNTTAFFTMF
jgi:hypothetical protein